MYSIEEKRLRNQKEEAVRVAKENAVKEAKYIDSLATAQEYILNLVYTSNLRLDSLNELREQKNKVQIVIRNIHPENLTSLELLARFEKRYSK